MRIALCDDEQIQRDQINIILEEYRTPSGEKCIVDIYTNAIDLLAALKTVDYDALLLDVIMPGFSGIDAARDIRKDTMSLPIVFLTSSPEFAVESYRVHAFDYLLKPVNTGDLYRTLNHLFSLTAGNDCLNIKNSKGMYSISYNQLEFVEISNRVIHFHCSDGSCIEVRAKLSDYEDILLERKNFLKVHRSYIINMDLMKSFDKKQFVAITGEIVPVSRNMVHEVLDSYMQYLHGVVHKKV